MNPVIAENTITTPSLGASAKSAMTSADKHSIATVLQPVHPSDCPGWDAMALAHPRSSIFHSAAWAKTLQKTYGFEPVYYMAGEADGRSALLPLMEVDSWLTGRRGIALPFTDGCEPLYSDSGAIRKLVASALEFGKTRRWKSVEWRGGRELFGNAPASMAFHGHSVELEMDEERMFARLEGSVQRAIRKAEKNGVAVSVSQSLEAMKVFYNLHCLTRRKHGLPPQPFAFFQNIFEHLLSKKLGMVAVATWHERPIAASVCFQWGERAVYKYGASVEAFQHLRGVNAVMWEAMKWLARHGATTLDFGRTSLGNEGLRRFKLGWGASEQLIEYVKYDLRKNRFVTETDPAAGWHNRVFKLMPVRLSRLMGAMLYRHCA